MRARRPVTSIPWFAIAAQGPHVLCALPDGLVHAFARAGIGDAAPWEVGPASRRVRSNRVAPVPWTLIRPEFRMRFAPLLVSAAVLVEHHSETDTGALITLLAELVQPRTLGRGAVLRLSGCVA